jgi:D-alanine-D-alanine ligase
MGEMTVGVIFGGRSGEHEISLLSARSVIGALDPAKYGVVQIAITKDGRWLHGPNALDAMEKGDAAALQPVTLIPEPGSRTLFQRTPDGTLEPLADLDVVFPVLHGTFGEDGTIQGLLEMAEIPYVGAGVLGSSVGMDKALFKSVMRAHNIPIVDYLLVLAQEIQADAAQVAERVEALGPYPLFTKPANLGSSVGISKCKSRSDLIEGLRAAARYDRRVVVEKGIEAREIEVSVLGNDDPEASVPGEVVPSDEFYSYRAKYIDDTSELLIPAPLDEATVEEARRLAVEAYKAIDCAGMARADFLLERDTGKLYINELNTLPGFTRISMYPKLWEASGLPYPQLADRLIELALERFEQKRRLVRSFEVDG